MKNNRTYNCKMMKIKKKLEMKITFWLTGGTSQTKEKQVFIGTILTEADLYSKTGINKRSND